MHIPVLKKEVLEYLDPKPNENFIDCTIGQGGHTKSILEKNGPSGKVLGMDQDPRQIENCKLQIENFKERLLLVNDSYIYLKEIVKKNNFKPVHGILLDLGMSNWHLEESGRGFSFLKDEPLDMRYNIEAQSLKRKAQNYLTAERIVNEYQEEEIKKILEEYGEERFSERIAREIVKARKIKPIETTLQLVEIIKRAVPYRGKINPATKTFQALRIAVNDELNNLKKVLPQTIEVLDKEGRIAIISFHSLEDRIVKNFFKQNNTIKILTKKPITASLEEIKLNPKSRSAKLRAAIKF
jgi:16S rRNA (cytosine1402-N4)-methyltransferase